MAKFIPCMITTEHTTAIFTGSVIIDLKNRNVTVNYILNPRTSLEHIIRFNSTVHGSSYTFLITLNNRIKLRSLVVIFGLLLLLGQVL